MTSSFSSPTVAQALYAVAILRAPSATLFCVGIIGNLAIFALWLVTRTIGIPVFGPHAGEVEEVGPIDIASKLVELLLVIILGAPLRSAAPRPRVMTPRDT